MNEFAAIQSMLKPGNTIAVIGLSDNSSKPSNYVPAYMQQHGFRILPVNPAVTAVLGEKAYASLAEVVAADFKPDVVNVFRLPKFIPAIVDDMITLGLTRLWIQQGIIDLESAARAEAAGIQVVMDRCIMMEHRHST